MANTRLPCFQASRRFLLLRLNLPSLRPCAEQALPMTHSPHVRSRYHAQHLLWSMARLEATNECLHSLWIARSHPISVGNRQAYRPYPAGIRLAHRGEREDPLEALLRSPLCAIMGRSASDRATATCRDSAL
ncbi:hypothetical protein NUW54_g13441 [Trametes sanguinea]|uniref:Uncharacterized protein n=1 Tax=Trametes sanguinea TaxID=158606 RepID=A0ACC1MLX8_9APHY|nr:hypothetical protein NUW54_g13441 [Trametes sanguinea]